LGRQVSPNDCAMDKGTIYLSLEEVIIHAGRQVLAEVDFKNALIVCDVQGILGQQLRPRPIPSLNVMINILNTDYKLTLYSKSDNRSPFSSLKI